jgi:predicted amidophosphoribosyltransferase
VDDVMTTGSTAHEIAQTLLDGGARSVKVLTLARAVSVYI